MLLGLKDIEVLKVSLEKPLLCECLGQGIIIICGSEILNINLIRWCALFSLSNNLFDWLLDSIGYHRCSVSRLDEEGSICVRAMVLIAILIAFTLIILYIADTL